MTLFHHLYTSLFAACKRSIASLGLALILLATGGWGTPAQAQNQAPVAGNDRFSVSTGEALTVDAPGVLQNDGDPNGDNLSATLVSGPSSGTITLDPDGSFQYTPDAGFAGPDTLSYQVADGNGATDMARVIITVVEVAIPPITVSTDEGDSQKLVVGLDPEATDTIDAALGEGEQPPSPPSDIFDARWIDGDISAGPFGEGLVVDIREGNSDFTGTKKHEIEFQPGSGTDSVTVAWALPNGVTGTLEDVVTDGDIISEPMQGSGSVTVTNLSIRKLFLTLEYTSNSPPTASDDNYSTPEGQALQVEAPGVLENDSDPDGDALSASVVSDVSHGTLDLDSDGSFEYTPGAGFTGTDQFTYEVSDGNGNTDQATVTMDVETQSAITLDGQLGESAYIPLGGNSGDDETGFGSVNDIDSLVYYPAEENGMLYIAAAGTLEAGKTNGFGFYLNVSGSGAPSGTPAGTSLGLNRSTDYHFISGQEGGTNDDFTADFEVDVVTAVAPISSSEAAAHLASYTGSSPTVTALDTTDQNGTPTSSGGVEYALLNSEAPMTGVEWKIPFSAIGATADQNIQVSAFVVSSTGYFSNEIIPGDGTMISEDVDGAGNPGFNAQWHEFVGGPWHTGGDGLPVELVDFAAKRNESGAVLSWTTASETGNAGFSVQHAAPGAGFEQIGWVDGVGTTTEAQTYRFVAKELSAGTHRFRLKQEDVDGSTSLSETVSLNVRPEEPVVVQPVSPNPVTGTSTLRFTARESGPVTVALYDVLGREVKTLYRGRVSGSQSQRVMLDASGLSSGTYFLRFEGDGFTKHHRITVAR